MLPLVVDVLVHETYVCSTGRPTDRECDGTDTGEVTVLMRDGGVSTARF